MEEQEKICRLCFTTISDSNYETLEGLQTEMIKIVSIPLNFSISEEPAACSLCTHTLQKCFDFKMTCLNTEDCVKTFANSQNPLKVDLRDVLLKELLDKGTIANKNTEICRLCFSNSSSSFKKLDNVEDAELRRMVNSCVPELDLSLTVDPLICSNCFELLEQLTVFTRTCLVVEEKIKAYCAVNMINSMSKVDLREVLGRSTEMKTEPVEQTQVEFVEYVSKNVVTKPECKETNNRPVHNAPAAEPTVVLFNSIGSCESKTYACKDCDFETQSKRDLKIHCLSHSKGKKLYECPLCPFISRHRNVITNHELIHKNSDEIDWYQCPVCTYRTKLKANLRNHSQTHGKPEVVKRFKCEECPFRTVWRRDLERHIVKHKEPAQVTMYKCDYCGFTTKYERYLKQHIAKLHLGGSERDDSTYSCANCSFTTKLKRSLVPHMLVHRNLEDLKIYRCTICPYQAKWKESVKKHELIHKNKFKCDECDFVTTLKRYLVKHKSAHRSLELVPAVHSCQRCPFQTLRKNGLQHHMLVHKTAGEVPMHACPHCEYRTKRQQDLKQHVLLIHTEDIAVYSCAQCSYRTKYKNNYRQHERLMHRSPTEVVMHKCDQCAFATKYKSSLLSHIVSYHKSPDEIEMIKCPQCDFETKRRECLRMHLVTHKRPDEMDMFQCGECGFQTKYKRALKKHMTGHKPGAKMITLFKCDQCDFETKWKQTIRKHGKRHGGGEGEGWTVVRQQVGISKEEVVA